MEFWALDFGFREDWELIGRGGINYLSANRWESTSFVFAERRALHFENLGRKPYFQ